MRNLFKVSLIAGSLAFGGLLYAQDGAGDDTENKKDPTTDVELTGEKRVELEPLEMRRQANKHLNGMLEGLKKVVEIQQVARKQKDIIKLNCVNDKLLQVKQLMNISESANTDMAEAIAKGDENERYHQFGKITLSSEKVRALVEEAKNCIGEELVYIGDLQVDVDRPDVEDPGDDDFDPNVEPPAYASPFR